MEVSVVHRLVDSIVSVDGEIVDRERLDCAVADVGRLLSWCQGQQLRLARRVAEVAAFPERALAGPAHIGLGAAARLLERVTTAEAAPRLGTAVADGAVSGEHLDALSRTLRSVPPEVRDELIAGADELVDVATASTPEEFARRLRLEARRLERDDGVARFERQCRDTRLRTWADQATGMWCLSGRFDPFSGVKVAAALEAEIGRRFAETAPATCPADPVEKNDHLRALAFIALVEGSGGRAGRPEAIVVLDGSEPDPLSGGPIVDWGLPVDIPARVLDEVLQRASIHVVVVRNGVVIDAPGELDLGRTTRLANRAQRRALRALYTTCAVPGCAVRYDHCRIHHVIEWEHGGRTDLVNLLPVCAHHHSRIHKDDWRLSLSADRTLTITWRDGNVLSTGPPRRRPP